MDWVAFFNYDNQSFWIVLLNIKIMRTIHVFCPLTAGFLYFFSLLWHFNYVIHGEVLYAVIARAMLVTALAFIYYFFSLTVALAWTMINNKSFMLKLFKFLVTPYVTLFWVVKFDFSIVFKSSYSILLAVVLAATLLFGSKSHLIWCNNLKLHKRDVERRLGPKPWSMIDILPIALFYLFSCSLALIFPSTFLNYLD